MNIGDDWTNINKNIAISLEIIYVSKYVAIVYPIATIYYNLYC